MSLKGSGILSLGGRKPGLTILKNSAAAFSWSNVTSANIVARYDFSAIAGNDGDAIAALTDLGTHGLNLAQATSGKRPLLKKGANGINGLSVGRFDGVDDILDGTPGAWAFTAKHVMVVARYAPATFASFAGLVSSQDSAQLPILTGNATSGSIFFDDPGLTTVYHKDGVAKAEASMTAPVNNVAAVCSISNAAGNWANYTLRLGQDRNNASRFWNGDMGEVVLLDAVLSTADRQYIEGGWKTKWGTA